MPDESTARCEANDRRAALAGDADAWADWVARTYAPVEAYVRWRCGGVKDLADDCLQETWLTAARKVRQFDPTRGDFAGWVCGVARNVVRNQLRARRRHGARHRPLSEHAACPHRHDGTAVAEALATLPERHEAVLRAKYLDGRTVREIAADWGETEKAVESLLTRARDAFRAAYERSDHADR